MATTFQKRQKEMKRMEKQRAKAERRAQKKQEKRDNPDAFGAPIDSLNSLDETFGETPAETEIAPPLDHGTP
jgi:hypothetical protein